MSSVTKFILVSIHFLLVAGSINENIIDTECHSDTDCKEFEKMDQVANTTCFNHHCLCKDSEFKTIQCLPHKQGFANVIGGKCPCSSIKWSICANEFCMCKPDFTASEDNRSCIPKKVLIGSDCENNDQCSKETTFATCTNHTCSCKSDFTFYNGTCQSLVGLEKQCNHDDECLTIPNALCSSQQCFCKPGFVANFDRTGCLPNADYNDGCLESVQCQHKLSEGAVCELGKCICGEDFSRVTFNVANATRSICENRIFIGQTCAYDTDCFQSRYNVSEQRMFCFLKECQCQSDYEPDRDQRLCVKSKLTGPESTWLDSIVAKVSSTFTASSGHCNNSVGYSMVIVCIVSIILFV